MESCSSRTLPAASGGNFRASLAAGCGEAVEQLKMLGPLAVSMVLSFMISLVTLAMVGACGSEALAAAGLGTALCTATGRVVIMGLCGAVDTTTSQAVGAGRLDLLGPIYRRSVIFLLGHCAPIALLWLSSLLWLPRLTDPTVGRLTSRYLVILLGDLVSSALWRPMNRILASQRITWPQMAVSALVLPSHWAMTKFFVDHHGVLGAAVATSLSGFLTLLLMAGACICIGQRSVICGGAQTVRALRDAGISWRSFARLAYPSAAMRVLESWGFSGMVTVSALLPAAAQELDVMSLSLNMYTVFFMLFVALGICADTRVGNALGKGSSEEAKRGLLVSVVLVWPGAAIMALIFGVPQSFQCLATMLHVGELQAAVKDELQAVFRIISGFVLLDGLQTALSGAIRGAGQQEKGARICVVAYWLTGIPTALLLAFPLGLKSTGLWLGMAVGPTVQLVLYARLLARLDWGGEAARCAERLGNSAGRLLEELERSEAAGPEAPKLEPPQVAPA